MAVVYLLILAALQLTHGCSVPEGGYKEPTVAALVHWASTVAVGEVTKIIRPDLVHRDDSTYSAEVTIMCSYKGEQMPANITIVGAGFIPGMCTSKDLETGGKYILFLNKRDTNGDVYYEQNATAMKYTDLMKLLKVCDMEVMSPKGEDSTCPPASRTTCQRYDQESGITKTENDGNGSSQTRVLSLGLLIFSVVLTLM